MCSLNRYQRSVSNSFFTRVFRARADKLDSISPVLADKVSPSGDDYAYTGSAYSLGATTYEHLGTQNPSTSQFARRGEWFVDNLVVHDSIYEFHEQFVVSYLRCTRGYASHSRSDHT